jgi:hypothetical protein
MKCPHLSQLSAIRWKLPNLARLKKSNPGKFAQQARNASREPRRNSELMLDSTRPGTSEADTKTDTKRLKKDIIRLSRYCLNDQ